MIPDRGQTLRAGAAPYTLFSLRTCEKPMRERSWTQSEGRSGPSLWPVERELGTGCSKASYLGRWVGNRLFDLVYTGGGAPIGEYYDTYLARPVPAAWMDQHLICLCWSVNHLISSEAPRGPGPAAGPGRGARSVNLPGAMKNRFEVRTGGKRYPVDQQSSRPGTGQGHNEKSYDP